MISTGDLRKGLTIEFEGQPCSILDWQHVKMGRGGAIIRMKLRNLRTGSTIDRTADAGDCIRIDFRLCSARTFCDRTRRTK